MTSGDGGSPEHDPLGTASGAVQLSFSALPAHVRTARLVAAAVARRSGVDEAVLDEVRLAVGEACSRAVELHRRHCPTEPVRVRLLDGSGVFRVEVTDAAPVDGADDSDEALATLADRAETAASGRPPRSPRADAEEALPSGVGLAVISGLVDDVVIAPGPAGTSVRMRWITAGS